MRPTATTKSTRKRKPQALRAPCFWWRHGRPHRRRVPACVAAGTSQERRGRRRREARSAARARPRAEGCGRRPPGGAWRVLPSCSDSRCRSALRADGACREKQPVPGPRRETRPRGTTRLVTPETGRDRGRRGHVVRTRALAERASTGRAWTGAAEQREAAERVHEGARHGQASTTRRRLLHAAERREGQRPVVEALAATR